jgi:iron complex outermembrane recepter protein
VPAKCLVVVLLAAAATAARAQQPPTAAELSNKSLEELMNIEVTSVSRRAQKLSRTPAAIYVITQEDIERSGAVNIPDLLRMAPGVDVAQVDANRWAISVRGFNDVYSNKLLVLIDGRTVYDPVFSGVYWDQNDVPLDDIERIEVIRGPGGTVWGANAVNGVINIITKSARDTQGLTLTAGTGSARTSDAGPQYGGKIGKKGYYRVFGDYFSYGNLSNAQHKDAADGWLMRHGGFRADWNLSGRDSLTVEGDIHQTNEGQTITTGLVSPLFSRTFNDKVTDTGGSVLGRWDHTFSSRSSTSLQFYEDHETRLDSGVDEHLDTADFDFQHHLVVGSRQDIVWGLGYRYNDDHLGPGFFAAFNPAQRGYSLFSGFLQDEIRLTDSVSLTLGSKLEHNAFTGFEEEPSAQLSWAIDANRTLWLSASKAITQPGIEDENVAANLGVVPLPGNQLASVVLLGNPDFRAERLRDYEAGYRSALLSEKVSLDLTAFYSVYSDLRTIEPLTSFLALTPPPPHLVIPEEFGNGMRGQDYGAEASLDWNVVSRWKLRGGYSVLKMNLHPSPTSQDMNSPSSQERESPEHEFSLRSYLDLTHSLSFDNSLYYVGRLPYYQVPAYTRLDSRFAWHTGESFEASIVGQNLLGPRRFEFGRNNQFIPTQSERAVFGRITWTFH